MDYLLPLVTADQMRQIDREAIEGRKIPGATLMENAGRGIAERILEHVVDDPAGLRVTVFCGKGNNGGDGYVIARYLNEAGCDVRIYFLGPIDKLSSDARLNFDRAAGIDLSLTEITSVENLRRTEACDLVIDAVFGTGFSGAPRGLAAEMIEAINLQDAPIVSVDLPSGLNADIGAFEGSVVAADFTFTLALPKYGLYLSPGREKAGIVDVVPIGIPEDVVESFDLPNLLTTVDHVMVSLPERPADGHKGVFGKLLVIAGSTGLTGAATMAADAANRSGCGLTKVACPRSVQPILAGKLTEVMTWPLPDVAKKGALALRGLGEIRKLLEQHGAAVIGPGIGTHHETVELMRRLVTGLNKPSIIDADGLNCLAKDRDILKACDADLVLTPHPGEFKRLFEREVPQDILEKAVLAREVASEFGVVLVLKGSPTLVAAPDGRCCLNPTGNSGMATGGSGDVLSGMVGSFLAQGVAPFDAAVVAVFLHGLAGDFAAEELGERSMVAGDLISYLPDVFLAIE